MDVTSRTGLLFGAYAEISLYEDLIIFQPEILYTQKGFEGPLGREHKLTYIEIPLLVKVPYLVDKTVSPFIYLGPFVGINIDAEAETIHIMPNNESSSFVLKEAANATLGIIVGTGVDISHFEIGVRYSAGLTPAYEGKSSAKNGVLSVVAGYTF